MELQIINPDEELFIDQLGIGQVRADELAAMMDKVLLKRKTGKPESVSELFKEIAFHCKDLQELTFCIVSHCSYMAAAHGYVYCMPQLKKTGH